MSHYFLPRIRLLIDRIIDALGIDLRGVTVLTEAASAYYALTPLIAAQAGAARVLAMGRDTRYGSFQEVTGRITELADAMNLAGRIEFLSKRDDHRIADADIVTNLGMVRPLDASFLGMLNRRAVVPLMWETWEFRPEDLDLSECLRLNIPVLGTNEHHPDLQIFPYVAQTAVKLLHEAGFEIFRSRIALAGHGEFASLSQSLLERMGAEVQFADSAAAGSLREPAFQRFLTNADALLVVDHHHRRSLIGSDGELTAAELAELNPAIGVVHISGGVDGESLSNAGVLCWPQRFAPAGYMSAATDYVGPRALIDLHAAGLRVGQEMLKGKRQGRSASDIMMNLPSEFPLAMGFHELPLV
jgi:hypothetical protein